jgi:AcrR family transcriptional regulator
MVRAVKRKRTYNAQLRQEQAQVTRQRILDAARRLLVRGTYSSVTIEEIAREAGVAYQTVYSIFGTKLRVAQAIIEVGFPDVAESLKLFDALGESRDPEPWLRTGARVSRRINEACADLIRFMRESGDPGLLARYRQRQEEVFASMTEQYGMARAMQRSGRLRASISASEAVVIIWSMTSPDLYSQLVFDRGWTPDRYEEWLGQALINVLLEA